MTNEITKVLLETLQSRSAQEIIIRVLCIVGVGVGMRFISRWIMHNIGITRKRVWELSNRMTIPVQFIASFLIAYTYRYSFVSKDMYHANGQKVHKIVLEILQTERLVFEGFLFAIGSCGVYLGLVIFLKILEKKFKINIITEKGK